MTAEVDRERAGRILGTLRDEFPDWEPSLDFENPYQLLIATILAARCTDERVNGVTPELFEAYPTPADLADADPDDVKEIVRPTGFYNQKTGWIQGAAEGLVERYGGEVPDDTDELTTLTGVARKTANMVRATAYGADEVFVDGHVRRVSQRLGFTEEKNTDEVERDLRAIFDEEDWAEASWLLVFHGRETCSKRSPDCEGCAVSEDCPSAFSFD